MSTPGRIVILNGVGSAGKSSIARALQAITREPFLHLQMDTFLDMMPPALLDHPDGFQFIDRGTAGVEILTGRVGRQAMSGMRHAIGAMAWAGNNLIVDDVLINSDGNDYAAALQGLEARWVGVIASLAVLEAREAARGDRMTGLARWQFGRVHEGIVYDLEIDTARHGPEIAAHMIMERFAL